ncbi:MAG: helix-hairpin-helix domain-containing protein [Deltaproteobacteria bacterium]|jgi:competence protein ComEA
MHKALRGLALAFVLQTGTALAAEPVDKLDLNTATIAQLVKLPGVGPKRADAIVKLRERVPFRRVRDLLRVRGIGRKSLARLRPLVRVAPPKVIKPRRAARRRGRTPQRRRSD